LTPVPLSGMATGLILVLSVTVIAPVSRPVVVGANVTLTEQCAPMARLPTQLRLVAAGIVDMRSKGAVAIAQQDAERGAVADGRLWRNL
jgi:hypothetical protein